MSGSASLIRNKVSVPKEFNKIAARYDLATGLSQGYQEDLDRSAGYLQLKGNEAVLDLCCGTGKSTAAVFRHITTGSITGVDNSEEMLVAARRKFADEISAGKLRFELEDAMQLSFPDQSFDAIFMAYGLRNMPDYDRCIASLYRLLKPGGRIVIHDYSIADAWYARPFWFVLGYFFILPFCTVITGSSRIFRYLVRSVLTFLTPSQAVALFARHGYTEVHAYPHKGWRGPILHAFVARRPV